MLTNRTSLSIAALAGIGLAMGSSASAQTIVQTFTVGPPAVSVPFSNSFTFNKFNTALGVLGSVTLNLNANVTAEVDVFNTGGTASAFTNATATIPLTLTAPDTVITGNAVAGPISGTANPGANAFPGLPANINQTTNIASLFFPDYEGAGMGTGTLTAASSAGTYSGTGNSNLLFGGNASVTETITLTYNYQSAGTVPEPGTVTFLAAGVLGSLGMVIRRRKRA
jgi:hypothetical protein